jgi:hypothetical protein
MKILLLSDGIPGHVNQSKGLIQLLKQKNPNIVCDEILVKLRHKWLRAILKLGLNKSWRFIKSILFFAYRINHELDIKDYDLILSAGGNTSYINAQLAKNNKIKNIFIGSLRNLDANLFSINLTIEKTPYKNNLVMMVAPCLTTREATIYESENYFKKYNDKNIWLMVIGGDGAGCTYSYKDWTDLVKSMIAKSESLGIKWLITTSRRTGIENEKIIKNLVPKDIIFEAIWFNHKPKKKMSAYLGMASKTFCTADSMSMISESIFSCTQTTVLMPETCKMTKNYHNALVRLENNDLIKTVPIKSWRNNTEVDSEESQKLIINKMNENINNIYKEITKKGIKL